jgi:hypothetical protein
LKAQLFLGLWIVFEYWCMQQIQPWILKHYDNHVANNNGDNGSQFTISLWWHCCMIDILMGFLFVIRVYIFVGMCQLIQANWTNLLRYVDIPNEKVLMFIEM